MNLIHDVAAMSSMAEFYLENTEKILSIPREQVCLKSLGCKIIA